LNDNNGNYRLATLTAAIAGVFSLVVCALLLHDYYRRGSGDPLENQAFIALKNALALQPDNEELKSEIRAMDLHLRQRYFRQRAFTLTGAGLLIAGVAIFLISAKTAATLRRKLPQPQPLTSPKDIESQWTAIGRRAVVFLSFALIVVAIALSVSVSLEFPRLDRQPIPRAIAEAPPTEVEIARAWPSFRGPSGQGVSAYLNIPTEWDAATGKNLRWKTPVPLPGNNSPVVWNDRVFLTGADEKQREVYCFDAASGKLIWKKETPGTAQSTAKVPKVNKETGYAAPTAATDGRRVFAIFANGDLAAFDFQGNLAWSKSLGIPDNAYGHASSLTMYKNLLWVQFDQGALETAGKSRLLAFDSATGSIVWEAKRPVPNSWASPIVIHYADQDQIITAANPWVIAYNPVTGRDIWRAKCLQGDIGPSPTFAAGKVFAVNESSVLSAIRVDGQDDVTSTHIVWRGEDGLPDICSPLANDEFVLLLTTYGTMTCYDAATGEQLWTEDFDEDCISSPSLVGKLVYVFANSGKGWIVEPQREKCQRIAEGNLGEECVTSPAFQDGCFYIRGKNSLFCIGIGD
jgi:outer membrane protein assembly factor BamB